MPALSPVLFDLCRKGRQPAEVLPPADRDRLLRLLWKRGWTVTEIAAHTRLSTYTTARILDRLELEVLV
jgi:DNA-binding MarR family transcriptional regulator